MADAEVVQEGGVLLELYVLPFLLGELLLAHRWEVLVNIHFFNPGFKDTIRVLQACRCLGGELALSLQKRG